MIAFLDYLKENFWAFFFMGFILWLFVGDGVRDAFYAVLSAVTGRSRNRRLSRKEEAKLRQRNDELQQAVFVAADILRDVNAADKVFPQLPPETSIRIEAFLDEHLQRPELPNTKRRKRQ